MGRWIITAIAAFAIAFCGGFAWFVAKLPESGAPTPDLSEIDGVAVLTGGGGARIKRAMSLFADGAGERLLISGVHPATPLDDLKTLWPGAEARFACCVDRGDQARTTRGNASEIAAWATEHGYARIVIVTSDYHLPRSVLELRETAPNLEIIAVAAPSQATAGHRTMTGWRLLASEYVKLQIRRADLVLTG